MDTHMSPLDSQPVVARSVVSNELLAARVHARLAGAVSNPGALEVLAQDGTVTLSGPVLAKEAAQLVRAVSAVPGVKCIQDQLERQAQRNGLIGLSSLASGQMGRFGFHPVLAGVITTIAVGIAFIAGLKLQQRRLRSSG